MSAILPRDAAVVELAACIRGRDHYVMPLPTSPLALPASPDELAAVFPTTTWYLDNGSSTILRLDSRDTDGTVHLVDVADWFLDPLGGFAVVVTAPKRGSDLSKAAHFQVPEANQDLIIGYDDHGRISFPTLFVDALDVLDPIMAAQLRAAMRV